MLAVLLVQITLIDVTGPGGQLIELNPSAIVTMRPPRRSDGFSPGSHCIITTADGKFTPVQEECLAVRKLLSEARKSR